MRGRKEYLPLCRVKRQQKVSNIHTQSKHQTSSNTRERDTLIWLPPQEAGIFRKSSKCKLIYYRQRTRGAGVQPNSRHQRVKAQTVSFSPQRLVSLPPLGALPPPLPPPPPSHTHLQPTATLTGMTEFYISTKTITEATGRSVCAGASSSLLTRERWMGTSDVARARADVSAELSADTSS